MYNLPEKHKKLTATDFSSLLLEGSNESYLKDVLSFLTLVSLQDFL